MSLKDWERDVLNRQRNIVFPDTNLNEGRFYRNLASGKAIFSKGQKISLLLIVFGCMSFYALGLASAIRAFLSQHNIGLLVVDLLVVHVVARNLTFLDLSSSERSFSGREKTHRAAGLSVETALTGCI